MFQEAAPHIINIKSLQLWSHDYFYFYLDNFLKNKY